MFESKINRGRANGYAPLDSEGKVPLERTYVGTGGTSGTSGSSGVTGTSGTSGETGTSGTSGETGTSGTSGETGTSGTSGETGTSGTSGTSILLDSNLSFIDNTIQGNNLNAAGTIITIATDRIGGVDINGNGLFVPNISPNNEVQVGDIVRFNDGTVRTVLASVPFEDDWLIQINANVSLFPAYPLTIESPDYQVGTNPFVEIKAGVSDWVFGEDGSLTLPNGDVIVGAPSNGTSGTSGTSGAQGISGTSGSAGTSGTSGQMGTSGTSGSTGTSGQTGSSGTSGQAGTSGSSGTSFASPYAGNLNVTSGQAWVSADVNGNTTSSTTVNWNDSNIQTFTLNTATTTFTFSNGQAGATYILVIRQNAAGSQTIVWPGTVAWPSAVTPTMTATANRYDVFTFIFDGTKFFGSSIQNFT